MEIESTLLAEPDVSSADSLVSSNDPNDTTNEQTWPTEDEMRGAEGAILVTNNSLPETTCGIAPKLVKRVPKGTSEYQAAWIIGESDEDEESAEGMESESDMKVVKEAGTEDSVAGIEEEVEVEMESRQSVTFQDLDIEEETKQ